MNLNEFTLLVIERETDRERLAGLLDLADKGLSDEDLDKAIGCVAAQTASIRSFAEDAAKITQACCLHWNGLSFEKFDFEDSQDEAHLLEALNDFFIDKSTQTVLVETMDTLNCLCRRALFHERPFHALFQLKALDVATTVLRLSDCDDAALACWNQAIGPVGEIQAVQDHVSLADRAEHVGHLFLRYWLASGKISKVKYLSLLRAMCILNAPE